MSVSITGYNLVTAAGYGAPPFFDALASGKSFRGSRGLCHIQDQRTSLSSLERLNARLLECISPLRNLLHHKKTLGILLASTKGMIEDYIWAPSKASRTEDSLTPLLQSFLKSAELSPKQAFCISNACASTHGALFVASKWLETNYVDTVLVISADEVGAFIEKGFNTLGALSQTGCRPFSQDRDGLQLGEAVTAIVLSQGEGLARLHSVAIDNEGHSITRPSPSGASLLRACRQVMEKTPRQVDAIIAHGTATKANDAAEALAFSQIFPASPLVTATKWSVGHTLGASGAIDLIAALECLRNKTLFSIGTTKESDPLLHCRFVLGENVPISNQATFLISSLGFGGTHAALTLTGAGV